MTNLPAPSDAVLTLRGHEPTEAHVELEGRSRQTRTTRAILTLVGFLVLAPIVFFIPPHFPWALMAVLAGFYLSYRQWTGEYVVHSFSGKCPRCGNDLKIESGAKIKLPHEMDCYECHHKPVLQVAGA